MVTIERADEKHSINVEGEVEFDSFAPSTEREAASNTIVIASYNIRYAVGSFLITGSIGRRIGLSMPGRRPRLVAHHLKSAALSLSENLRLPRPDILALQEADKGTCRSGGHHVARELARALRMNYARAAAPAQSGEEPKSKQWYLNFEEPIPPSDEGDTGIAILSRLPFERIERLELPWHECAWRPRLALAATFQNGPQRIHLFNSHIDPHATIQEQLEQHRAVLARAQNLTRAVILLGDFNTLSKRSRAEMRGLLESHGFTTPFPTGMATWRAGLIRLHMDWIFVKGAKVKRRGVARGLRVSDHWPIWAEIDLSEEAEGTA